MFSRPVPGAMLVSMCKLNMAHRVFVRHWILRED